VCRTGSCSQRRMFMFRSTRVSRGQPSSLRVGTAARGVSFLSTKDNTRLAGVSCGLLARDVIVRAVQQGLASEPVNRQRGTISTGPIASRRERSLVWRALWKRLSLSVRRRPVRSGRL
jgi:hypothetical protein